MPGGVAMCPSRQVISNQEERAWSYRQSRKIMSVIGNPEGVDGNSERVRVGLLTILSRSDANRTTFCLKGVFRKKGKEKKDWNQERQTKMSGPEKKSRMTILRIGEEREGKGRDRVDGGPR